MRVQEIITEDTRDYLSELDLKTVKDARARKCLSSIISYLRILDSLDCAVDLTKKAPHVCHTVNRNTTATGRYSSGEYVQDNVVYTRPLPSNTSDNL